MATENSGNEIGSIDWLENEWERSKIERRNALVKEYREEPIDAKRIVEYQEQEIGKILREGGDVAPFVRLLRIPT